MRLRRFGEMHQLILGEIAGIRYVDDCSVVTFANGTTEKLIGRVPQSLVGLTVLYYSNHDALWGVDKVRLTDNGRQLTFVEKRGGEIGFEIDFTGTTVPVDFLEFLGCELRLKKEQRVAA
jgi:hypothetical protein